MLNNILDWVTRLGDKAGFGGALVAGAGCSACFPALAGIGASLGLGFLAQWEGILVGRVIPVIAVLVIIINILGYLSHRQWHRSALGLVGPVLLLIGARTMNGLYLYPGLAFMLGVSLWDWFYGANKRCETNKKTAQAEN
tara:strand:- start:1895 stop:2314 length:420 start_codon:yes stop_codon:yes gene_type:complete